MEKIISISKKQYNEALIKLKDNKVTEAIKNLEQALNIYSRDIDTLNLMGLCQYIICDFKMANFYWSKSIEIKDDDNKAKEYREGLSDLVREYNEALQNLKNTKIAIEKFKEITKKHSELIEPYFILGLLYLSENKKEEAYKKFAEAYKLDKSNSRYLDYISYLDNKRKTNSKPFFFGGFAIILILAGLLGIKTKEYNENLESLKNEYVTELESYKKETKDKENSKITENRLLDETENVVFNEGIKYFESKNYKEAVTIFKEVKTYGIDEVYVGEATYYNALALEKSKEYNLAIEGYKDYIEKFKSGNYYDESIYNCGLLLYKVGKVREAKEILKRLEEIPRSIYFNSKSKYILNMGE